MVDNSSSSKAQTPILTQDSGLAGPFSQAPLGSVAGVKLEAVMEQLQRQQQAKLDMERKERHLSDAHILYAQQIAAQHAIMASARAQGMQLNPEYFKALREQASKLSQVPQSSRVSTQSSVESAHDDEDDEDVDRGTASAEEDDDDDDMDDEGSEDNESMGLEFLRKQSLALQQQGVGIAPYPYPVYAVSPSAAKKRALSPPPKIKDEPMDSPSPTEQHSLNTPNGMGDWSFDESIKQNGNVSWNEESDGGKARGEASRDFAKLYELDNDPNRKDFLDDLFTFMQKRGTPVNRIPIMAKQVLDLYKLFKLVTEKGGLVEVINKKIWREITKGLNLPTSITSAAFTLRTQYMKYLYPYECEKKGLSSPGELQAAIDSNRREGRRPGYSNSLYRFSPSPSGGAPHLLSPPKMHLPTSGHNGLQSTPTPALKKATVPEEGPASMLPGRLPFALALGHQQQLARAATLEQLRERLETGMGVPSLAIGAAAVEGPERKMARIAEEQHRLLQQALQQNLLAMASQVNPANLSLNNNKTREEKQDLSLSISSNGSASITVSIEVNGIIYSGSLYAQKSPGTLPNSAPVTSIGQSTIINPCIPSSSKSSGSGEPAGSGSP
ncbi:AT-rich interactive domain-containing protein 3B [Trichomycterus rosablanca]|uniref:AT-rich interactive domain-containing protein 3B n=1 Tax=Trichomycterus rosablanca TaxID=2290929 RepID=UPI002F35ED06